MDIVLYYAPITCAMAPYITLTEAGADFEARPLNFGKGEHMGEAYRKINPKHKVPYLIVDGKPLSESTAIQQWIARAFPEARLMPADPWDELKAVSLMSWFSGGIHPYLSRINSPPRVVKMREAEDSVVEIAREYVREGLTIADEQLAGREFFFDHFTAPDAHFFWIFRRAGQLGAKPEDFANCAAHFARVGERPSVKKLLAFEKQTLEAFAKAA